MEPTDEQLETIANWPFDKGWGNLLEYVHELYAHDYGRWETVALVDDLTRKTRPVHKIATGGWSHNETLIGALQRNWLFWSMCWLLSKRGGYYEFEVR